MVFHVELRRFPYKACSYNLSEEELLGTVVSPWVGGGWVSMGEREWNAHETRIRILEGPELEVAQISLGRGWKSVERTGRDVTAQLLAAARGGAGGGQAPTEPPRELRRTGAEGRGMLKDSLGMELLQALGEGSLPLGAAWSRAAARLEGAAPAESLGLAEEAVRALLKARLVSLSSSPEGDAGAGGASPGAPTETGSALELVGAPESWGAASDAARVWLRRV